jgi:23S rRNA (adenine1618-N6)-methyltransferase
MLEVGERVNTALSALPLQWKWRPDICTGVGFAARNVWSRAARRHSQARDGDEEEEDDMAFGFKITVRSPPATENVFLVTEVTVRWLKGREIVVFESFCGMVKRKVEAP